MAHTTIMDVSKCGLANTLNGFITLLSVDKNTKIKTVPDYELGNMGEILDTSYIKPDNEIYMDNIFWCSHFLVLKTETDQKDTGTLLKKWRVLTLNPVLDTFFNNNVHIGLNFDRTLICEKVKNRYFNTLDNIKWNTDVLKIVDSIEIKKNSLAITVRTWTHSHEKTTHLPYSFEEYRDVINRALTENKYDHIYFTIDNEDKKEPYIELLNKTGIPYTELNLKLKDVSEIRKSLSTMMLVSKCNTMVCNRISTFACLAFWFSRLTMKVYTVF
jgi:hypothetical protein